MVVAPRTRPIDPVPAGEAPREGDRLHETVTLICNRCDVPVQIDTRNDTASRVHCPVCGNDFGTWADVRASSSDTREQAAGNRDGWHIARR